jgi:hypothetical protein
MSAAERMLGITKPQIASMQKKVDALERENDAIALTRVRHQISEYLVSIRLLLRDGNTNAMNGGKKMATKTFTVFCQEADGTGTIWISSVQARDLEDAKLVGLQECADDWGYSDDPDNEDACGTLSDIHVLGVAEGTVKILDWEDIYG